MLIYKITNKVNNKIYIGCTTVSLEKRWKRHIARRKDNSHLARAIISVGSLQFTIEEIEKLNTIEEMYNRERYWINFYNSNDFKIGYNMTLGGDTGPIFYGSDNSRFGKKNEKLSNFNRSRKGQKLSPDRKEKLRLSLIGRKHSGATKKIMSEKRKESWDNGRYDNIGERISLAKKGVASYKKISILCLNNYKVYNGYTEAALKLGVSSGNISNIVTGKRKHTKGFVFEKLTEDHLIF